jgi:hypothetical protein
MAQSLNAITINPNSVAAWSLFWILPACILHAPHKKGKVHSRDLTKIIKDRIKSLREGKIGPLWLKAIKPPDQNRRGKRGPAPKAPSKVEVNNRRCLDLLRSGLYRRAAEALVTEGLDFDSPKAAEAMADKHLARESLPSLPEDPNPASLQFFSEQVLQGLKSFRPGFAPGPSGLRAEHIKAATHCPTTATAERCQRHITS